MVYESQISFTLDVICPWYVTLPNECVVLGVLLHGQFDVDFWLRTYLAKKRSLLAMSDRNGANAFCRGQARYR